MNSTSPKTVSSFASQQKYSAASPSAKSEQESVLFSSATSSNALTPENRSENSPFQAVSSCGSDGSFRSSSSVGSPAVGQREESEGPLAHAPDLKQGLNDEQNQIWKEQLTQSGLRQFEGSSVPLKDQITTVVSQFCQERLDPHSLLSDGTQAFEYISTYLYNGEYEGIEQDLQDAISMFKTECLPENFSASVRKESCLIERVPGGVRIIILGPKGEASQGSSNRFKLHNFVFYCDEELTKVKGWGDFIMSTHDKNDINELLEKGDFTKVLKPSKSLEKGERLAFIQANAGPDLSRVIMKHGKKLTLEDKRKIIAAIFKDFESVSKKQWNNKNVLSDIKVENMLMSKQDGEFVIKFIDYVAKGTIQGNHEYAPVTVAKLPAGLISEIQKMPSESLEDTPFYDMKSSLKSAFHPLMAYTQVVVACMELFLCNSIPKTTKEQRLDAKRHMDEMLPQVPELTTTPYFRKYYEIACEKVIQAESFMTANG